MLCDFALFPHDWNFHILTIVNIVMNTNQWLPWGSCCWQQTKPIVQLILLYDWFSLDIIIPIHQSNHVLVITQHPIQMVSIETKPTTKLGLLTFNQLCQLSQLIMLLTSRKQTFCNNKTINLDRKVSYGAKSNKRIQTAPKYFKQLIGIVVRDLSFSFASIFFIDEWRVIIPRKCYLYGLEWPRVATIVDIVVMQDQQVNDHSDQNVIVDQEIRYIKFYFSSRSQKCTRSKIIIIFNQTPLGHYYTLIYILPIFNINLKFWSRGATPLGDRNIFYTV